jgi:hypothetical protein
VLCDRLKLGFRDVIHTWLSHGEQITFDDRIPREQGVLAKGQPINNQQ